jgi:hypothetical protein
MSQNIAFSGRLNNAAKAIGVKLINNNKFLNIVEAYALGNVLDAIGIGKYINNSIKGVFNIVGSVKDTDDVEYQIVQNPNTGDIYLVDSKDNLHKI